MTRHIPLISAIPLLPLGTPLPVSDTPLPVLDTPLPDLDILLPILDTPLLVGVTPLLGLRIRHRGSPRSSTTLMFPTLRPRATQDLLFSHHPTSWSILRHPSHPNRLILHSKALVVTAHLTRPHKRLRRFRLILAGRPSHQYLNNLP